MNFLINYTTINDGLKAIYTLGPRSVYFIVSKFSNVYVFLECVIKKGIHVFW